MMKNQILSTTGRLVPVYSETKGLSSKWLRRQIHNTLSQFEDELTEYMPEDILKRNNFLDYKTAMKMAHFPTNQNYADKARERLSLTNFS